MPGPAKFGAAGRRIRALRRPGIIYCATTAAVETLRAALSDSSSAVRVRAAIAILQLGTELGEVTDLSNRLAQLEQYASQNSESR